MAVLKTGVHAVRRSVGATVSFQLALRDLASQTRTSMGRQAAKANAFLFRWAGEVLGRRLNTTVPCVTGLHDHAA
jgi:hypothetical protein